MTTPLFAESCGNQVDGWSTPTVPTVRYHLLLPLLMHLWEARWGDSPLHCVPALGALEPIKRCAMGFAAIDNANVGVFCSHGNGRDPDCG